MFGNLYILMVWRSFAFTSFPIICAIIFTQESFLVDWFHLFFLLRSGVAVGLFKGEAFFGQRPKQISRCNFKFYLYSNCHNWFLTKFQVSSYKSTSSSCLNLFTKTVEKVICRESLCLHQVTFLVLGAPNVRTEEFARIF